MNTLTVIVSNSNSKIKNSKTYNPIINHIMTMITIVQRIDLIIILLYE